MEPLDGYFKHTYYNTYYYANIVNNILSGDIEYIGFISSFFEPEVMVYSLAKPFQKRSAFHLFIEHIVGEFFDNDMHEHDSNSFEYFKNHRPRSKFIPYVDEVLAQYGMDKYQSDEEFENYSDVEEYHNSIHESGILEELYSVIAAEIFYIMFNNREALLRFNYIVADHMVDANYEGLDEDLDPEEYHEAIALFKKNGYLKRVKIPEWCKKAVFFRDRGKCCLCQTDLSGMLSLTNNKQFDHIVPLGNGGLNDVANIQLLCDKCNNIKSASSIETSNLYQRWYK